MVRLINVKNDKTYYEKLNVGITMSSMWNSLQTKSEVGLNKSEKGYQQIAKSMAGNIARGLDVDPNLTECLTMCLGCYFPAYGTEGKKAVIEYLRQKGITMQEKDVARNFVEHELDYEGILISPKFDEYLQEIFDDSKESQVPEVQIAKLCSRTLESIKKIEMYSNINQVSLLYALTKDVEELCISSGTIKSSDKLDKMLATLPKEEKTLSPETKKLIHKDLDEMVNYKGDVEKAVYDYIGTNER